MAIEWRVSSDGGKSWTHTDGTNLSPGEYLIETRVTDHADGLTDAINRARVRRDALDGIAQAELQGAIHLALYLDGWTSNQPAHFTLRGPIAEALDLLSRYVPELMRQERVSEKASHRDHR